MKITMTANYDWQVPNSRSWIAFKAGWSGRVTRAQGREMIAAGVAKPQTESGQPIPQSDTNRRGISDGKVSHR